MLGALTGSIAMLSLLGFIYQYFRFNIASSDNTSENDILPVTTTQTAQDITTPTTGNVAPNGSIAQISTVPANSAITFTLPSNSDPGVLVHLNNGQFVAYDAVCTHAGCQVDYDTNSHLLTCPCHGATFDPANGGAVISPPANSPLTAVTIHIDSATDTITLTKP